MMHNIQRKRTCTALLCCAIALLSAGTAHALSLRQERPEGSVCLSLSMPLSVYTWQPIGGGWQDKVSGIAGVDAGLDILFLGAGESEGSRFIQYMLRWQAGWRCCMGDPSTYKLFQNAVTSDLYAVLCLNLTQQQRCFVGAGIVFEADIFSIQPKYSDKETRFRRSYGLGVCAGHQFRLTKRISSRAEIGCEHFFASGFFDVLKVSAGITIGLGRRA